MVGSTKNPFHARKNPDCAVLYSNLFSAKQSACVLFRIYIAHTRHTSAHAGFGIFANLIVNVDTVDPMKLCIHSGFTNLRVFICTKSSKTVQCKED